MEKIAIVACSNPIKENQNNIIKKLITELEKLHLIVIVSPYLSSNLPHLKANILNEYFNDPSIDAIFDISGGDLSNELLSYLDYEVIKNSHALFYGYSDLTTIINAIHTQTNKPSILYQIKNIVLDKTGQSLSYFKQYLQGENQLFQYQFEVLQGKKPSTTIVVGGNIRCLLKLAGTPYFPNVQSKILFLEARSGKYEQLASYFAHLFHMGIFDQIDGLILGTFTEYEQLSKESIYTLIKNYIPDDLYVIKTNEIGHDVQSKALLIG